MRIYKSDYHLFRQRIRWWYRHYADGREMLSLGQILYEAETSRQYASNHPIEGLTIDGGTDVLLTYCLDIDDSTLWDRYTSGMFTAEEYHNYVAFLTSCGATFPHTLEEVAINMASLIEDEEMSL